MPVPKSDSIASMASQIDEAMHCSCLNMMHHIGSLTKSVFRTRKKRLATDTTHSIEDDVLEKEASAEKSKVDISDVTPIGAASSNEAHFRDVRPDGATSSVSNSNDDVEPKKEGMNNSSDGNENNEHNENSTKTEAETPERAERGSRCCDAAACERSSDSPSTGIIINNSLTSGPLEGKEKEADANKIMVASAPDGRSSSMSPTQHTPSADTHPSIDGDGCGKSESESSAADGGDSQSSSTQESEGEDTEGGVLAWLGLRGILFGATRPSMDDEKRPRQSKKKRAKSRRGSKQDHAPPPCVPLLTSARGRATLARAASAKKVKCTGAKKTASAARRRVSVEHERERTRKLAWTRQHEQFPCVRFDDRTYSRRYQVQKHKTQGRTSRPGRLMKRRLASCYVRVQSKRFGIILVTRRWLSTWYI